MDQDACTLDDGSETAALSSPAPGSIAGLPAPDARRRRWWHRVPLWIWIVAAVLAVLIALGSVAMSVVRLPYYTISPGSAVDVASRVSVDGVEADSTGEVLLLFVRQRAQVNGWRYLQAKLDPDIDLFDEEQISGGLSPQEVRDLADAEMAISQTNAKKVAMEAVGYEVAPAEEGLVVLAVQSGRPSDGVLERDDVLLEAQGTKLVSFEDLSGVLDELEPGDEVTLRLRRDGEVQTVTVETAANDDGDAVIGVFVQEQLDFPIDVDIDTADIGGPSAGLAMALSVIDALSPADITGGRAIAVTGTIDPDGVIGNVGGVGQKTVTARSNGAELMLVPIAEVDEARERAGDLEIVGVETIDDALDALEAAGGEPLVPLTDELLAA